MVIILVQIKMTTGKNWNFSLVQPENQEMFIYSPKLVKIRPRQLSIWFSDYDLKFWPAVLAWENIVFFTYAPCSINSDQNDKFIVIIIQTIKNLKAFFFVQNCLYAALLFLNEKKTTKEFPRGYRQVVARRRMIWWCFSLLSES